MANLIGLVHEGESIPYASVSYWYKYMGIPTTDVKGREVTGPGAISTLMPLMAQSFIKGNIIGRNLAVAASNLGFQNSGDGNLNDRASLYVDPIFSVPNETGASSPTRKYVFTVSIGTNDMCIGGRGTVGAYATEVAAYTARRKAVALTAGYTLVVGLCTVLPRNDVDSQEVNRAAYNSLLTNGSWRSSNGIDFVIDFASEATMGSLANCANTTYYLDGVHPTGVGHALLTPIYSSSVSPFVV